MKFNGHEVTWTDWLPGLPCTQRKAGCIILSSQIPGNNDVRETAFVELREDNVDAVCAELRRLAKPARDRLDIGGCTFTRDDGTIFMQLFGDSVTSRLISAPSSQRELRDMCQRALDAARE